MSKVKLMWAGLFVSCAFAAILLGMARATPPTGQTNTKLVGPVSFDDIDVRGRFPLEGRPSWTVRMITKGQSDGYFVDVKIAPGGSTGWHSHPGIVFAAIKSGTATEYNGDDPDAPPVVHPAGTGFVEPPGHVHLVRNEGSTDLEVLVFFLVPKGQPTRIDEPAPSQDDDH